MISKDKYKADLKVTSWQRIPKTFTGIALEEEGSGEWRFIFVKKGQWHRELAPAEERCDGEIRYWWHDVIYMDRLRLHTESDYWEEMYKLYPDNELVLSHILGGKQ